jgi:hypothetical protein
VASSGLATVAEYIADVRPAVTWEQDTCPECGGIKDTRAKRCAKCRWAHAPRRSVMRHGYVRVWAPRHPLANADGYALEHRLVLHDAGVEIPEGCHVHHRNGDKADNRLENLEVLGESEHHRHHAREAGVVVNQYGTWPVRA